MGYYRMAQQLQTNILINDQIEQATVTWCKIISLAANIMYNLSMFSMLREQTYKQTY